jgi:hypothetical protein
MKRLTLLLLPLLSLLFTSCELAGDIFQAGMGFGIFIVVAVVILVIYLVMKLGRGGRK